MKKLIQYTFLLALLGILSQCKKGEDDPGISFRSRKARVVGEWQLTSGSSVDISTSGANSSSTIYNYTENSYTRNYVSGAVNTSTSGIYSMKMTFERDGTFTWNEMQNTGTITYSGIWNFTGRVGDEYKNKEQITLKILSYTEVDGTYSANGTATGKDINTSFTIKELRNKKMVLTTESTYVSGSSTDNSKTETVLER